jgi:hypothetical protein
MFPNPIGGKQLAGLTFNGLCYYLKNIRRHPVFYASTIKSESFGL